MLWGVRQETQAESEMEQDAKMVLMTGVEKTGRIKPMKMHLKLNVLFKQALACHIPRDATFPAHRQAWTIIGAWALNLPPTGFLDFPLQICL